MQRKSPYQESTSQNIMAVILQSLPQEAELTKIEYEGPRIALYSRNPGYLMQNSQLVSNMVNTIKKRIVIRTDHSIRKSEDESVKIISENITKEAGVISTLFDSVLGEAIVFARKPWMLAQVGDDFDNIELAEKTGWKVRIRKAPQNMDPIQSLYRSLHESAGERTKFYREIGDKIFRDKLGNSTEASLTTLGGFAEIGRSCLLLTTPESKVLIDCGLNLFARDSLAAIPRFDVAGIGMEEIDAVVLSHAHMDHAGFLPGLFKYGYGGPVYCTEPTLLLINTLLRGYVKNSNIAVHYSEKDIDNAVTHTITLTHGIVTDISPDIKLVLSNSGHILGSTSVHLHIGNGDHNLVYTGDMKFGRTIALENASWNFPRVETLVIESTFGGKEDIMCPREEAESRLASAISKTVSARGHILIPVPVVGISQEIILVLDRFMKGVEARVFVEKSISEATAIYEAYPEFLSKEMRQRVLESEITQFGSQFSIANSETLIDGEPSVVLAPSSMLVGGPSINYLKQICREPNNKLILLSYPAFDTPSRAIYDGARQIIVQGESMNLQCQVEIIDGFGNHSDYNQSMEYVKRLRPKLRRVLVNHGERPKAQNLASAINKFFKIQTQHPLVQEAIKLL